MSSLNNTPEVSYEEIIEKYENDPEILKLANEEKKCIEVLDALTKQHHAAGTEQEEYFHHLIDGATIFRDHQQKTLLPQLETEQREKVALDTKITERETTLSTLREDDKDVLSIITLLKDQIRHMKQSASEKEAIITDLRDQLKKTEDCHSSMMEVYNSTHTDRVGEIDGRFIPLINEATEKLKAVRVNISLLYTERVFDTRKQEMESQLLTMQQELEADMLARVEQQRELFQHDLEGMRQVLEAHRDALTHENA